MNGMSLGRAVLQLWCAALLVAGAGCSPRDATPPPGGGDAVPSTFEPSGQGPSTGGDAGTDTAQPTTPEPDAGTSAVQPQEPDAGTSPDGGTDAGTIVSLPPDDDLDGIPDAEELALALKFAPEVRLSPQETALPANVDWYLSRVRLWMKHSGCTDHTVLDVGTITQQNLATQTHPVTSSSCQHTATLAKTSERLDVFYLKPASDAVKAGAPTAEWRVYARVRKSKALEKGIDVQYWFFYPFNDNVGSFDHESDWERITVVISASGRAAGGIYGQHGDPAVFQASELLWNGNHPVVYAAKGTHASYARAGTYSTGVTSDEAHEGGPVWKTWDNLVHIGEANAPLNGQAFLRYGGLWGSIGSFSFTTGTTTPSFKEGWENY